MLCLSPLFCALLVLFLLLLLAVSFPFFASALFPVPSVPSVSLSVFWVAVSCSLAYGVFVAVFVVVCVVGVVVLMLLSF